MTYRDIPSNISNESTASIVSFYRAKLVRLSILSQRHFKRITNTTMKEKANTQIFAHTRKRQF